MSEDKITKTLQLIKNDKSLEGHFFNKLAVSSKPLEWLVPLRNADYFAQKTQTPRVSNKKGYIPHWNILDALIIWQ